MRLPVSIKRGLLASYRCPCQLFANIVYKQHDRKKKNTQLGDIQNDRLLPRIKFSFSLMKFQTKLLNKLTSKAQNSQKHLKYKGSALIIIEGL